MRAADGGRELTGRHVLAILVAFFSVVVAVNLTMAYLARRSWTGFVVENVYVASREFNDRAEEDRAQAALGWKSELVIADGKISYRLTDRQGAVVRVARATVNLHRPASAAEDRDAFLARQPDGSLSAAVALRDGVWIVEVHADAGLAKPYRERRRLILRDGAAS